MSKQLRQPAAGDTVATIKTNKGDIKVVLFPDAAPKAVENFTTHADNGYYDGVSLPPRYPGFHDPGRRPDSATGMRRREHLGQTVQGRVRAATYHNLRGALCNGERGSRTRTAASSLSFRLRRLTSVLSRRWNACPICSRTSLLKTTRQSAELRGSISDTPCSVRCSRAWMLSTR